MPTEIRVDGSIAAARTCDNRNHWVGNIERDIVVPVRNAAIVIIDGPFHPQLLKDNPGIALDGSNLVIIPSIEALGHSHVAVVGE